jgi:hypothetical protein
MAFKISVVAQQVRATTGYDHVLLFYNLLKLSDLFLYLAGNPFAGAFAFQLGIIAELSNGLLDSAFQLVKLAFCLVLRTGFHDDSPFGWMVRIY